MEVFHGPIFAKLNNQDIQELQKDVVKYTKSYKNVLEGMDMEFMLRFYRSQQAQLDIVRCSYERDPSCLPDFARTTRASYILDNLIKDYNEVQSPTKGNQFDGQDDVEESSNVS